MFIEFLKRLDSEGKIFLTIQAYQKDIEQFKEWLEDTIDYDVGAIWMGPGQLRFCRIVKESPVCNGL